MCIEIRFQSLQKRDVIYCHVSLHDDPVPVVLVVTTVKETIRRIEIKGHKTEQYRTRLSCGDKSLHSDGPTEETLEHDEEDGSVIPGNSIIVIRIWNKIQSPSGIDRCSKYIYIYTIKKWYGSMPCLCNQRGTDQCSDSQFSHCTEMLWENTPKMPQSAQAPLKRDMGMEKKRNMIGEHVWVH
jgi:hypothetical protein